MKYVWLMLLLVLPATFASITINEVFPIPPDGDEWVELKVENDFANESPYVYLLKDEKNNAVTITKTNTVINGSFVVVYRYGGGWLNNGGDSVSLYDINDTLIDSLSYGKAKSGQSYGWFEGNLTWMDPTPASENVFVPLTIGPYGKREFSLGAPYDDFFKVINLQEEHLHNVSFAVLIYDRDNITVLFNQTSIIEKINSHKTSGTGKYTFSAPGDYVLCAFANVSLGQGRSFNTSYCDTATVVDSKDKPCNVSLAILSEDLFEEKIQYSFSLERSFFSTDDTPFVRTRYWITDLFNKTIKKEVETEHASSTKSYTPKGEGQVFVLHAEALAFCNDTTPDDNHAQKTVIVRGTPRPDDPSIVIESISAGSDDRVKFGETTTTNLILYRGNSTRYAVKTYITDGNTKISKISTTHVRKPYEESYVSVPVLLKSNCRQNIDDGTYTVVVEGFGLREEADIRIEGVSKSNCETITKTIRSKTEEKTVPKKEDAVLSFSDPIVADIPFAVSFRLTNLEKTSMQYNISSYAYKGSKAYSPSREHNMHHLSLQPGESREIDLEDVVSQTGIFSYKVRIFRSGYKTAKEIKETIFVEPEKTPAAEGFENISIVSVVNGSFGLRVTVSGGDRVLIDHPLERKERSVRSRKTFTITLPSAGKKTPLYLRLYRNETLIDVGFITVQDPSLFQDATARSIPEQSNKQKQPAPDQIVRSIDEASAKDVPITGNLIYESDRFRHLDYALYALVGILSLLCCYLLFTKKT